MQKTLGRLGLHAEFIEAVDGAQLTAAQRGLYDRRRALAVYGEEMSPAEIGCHLSHLSAYQRIVDEKIECALVLEDDIECDADLPQLLSALAKQSQAPWRVLRLQSTKTTVINGERASARGEIQEIVQGRTISRLRTGVLGGCGYLIRNAGAKAMLRYASRPFMPIDQAMDRYWENDILPYVLRPFPIRQSGKIASEIGERKVKQNHGPYLTALRRTRRAFDGVNKRRFQFVTMGGWRLAFSGAADKLHTLGRGVVQGVQLRLTLAAQSDG